MVTDSFAIEKLSENPGNWNESSRSGVKQGRSCCGGCCDMRRAVIIVNSVSVVILLFGFLEIIGGREWAKISIGSNSTDFDDPTQAAMEQLADINIGWVIVSVLAKVIVSFVGIFGALYFNIYMVGVAGLMYGAQALYFFITIFAVSPVVIGNVILAACFAYPHYFFIQESRNGSMTKANYPNEKQSCCCV